MILAIYLIKKFFISLFLSILSSFSIFFIFSLIGNLGENISFSRVIYFSILNSIQIFMYLPGYLLILGNALFIIFLKSKNELLIIKEYLRIEILLLIISPFILVFTIVEINKELISNQIQYLKSNSTQSNNLEDLKVIISTKENNRKYIIFKDMDKLNNSINEYLEFEVNNNFISRGEFSSNVSIDEEKISTTNSIIYENNILKQKNVKKIILEDKKNYLEEKSTFKKINLSQDSRFTFIIFYQILFFSLFYFCILNIFFSKKFVNKNINFVKILTIILLLFFYYLLIPNINLNSFNGYFHIISLVILLLTFLNLMKYE